MTKKTSKGYEARKNQFVSEVFQKFDDATKALFERGGTMQRTEFLFERTQFYASMRRDPDLIAALRASDKNLTIEEFLDAECADINCSFRTLMNVLQRFPDKADWGKMKLREMIAQLFIEQKEREKKDRDEAKAIRQQAQKIQAKTT